MKYGYEDVDERIVKTRIALTGAILHLIEKDKKIKVLDICHEANITAMTYYHHFKNLTELLDFTIKSQLKTILPIPQKLKPISVKHLFFYLINNLGKFIIDNQKLIYSSIQQNKKHGYYNSYMHLVFTNIKYFIKQELRLLCFDSELNIELWNNMICGSLFNIFIQMITNNHFVSTKQVWMSIKSFSSVLI